MFGYFRFNQLFASPRVKNVYKNYYCGTCFALEYNFGEIARFVLSYDAVILALAVKANETPNERTLPCFFSKKKKEQFYRNEKWRKIAAINMLLLGAKIQDDINDKELSPKSKAAGVIFRTAIVKARQQHPDLSEIIVRGYRRMFELESTGSHILEICEAFSDLMSALMEAAFPSELGTDGLNYIKCISRWLYFIDQLDDYDTDIVEAKYNPLVIPDVNKELMINQYHTELFETLRQIMMPINIVRQKFRIECLEDYLLYAILSESIPTMTMRVMMGRNLPKFQHGRKQIEWNN